MSEFKKVIEFLPAFDKRDPDPKKNYGIHGVDLRFYLTKDNRTIQFVIYTNWFLPHVAKEHLTKFHSPDEIEMFFMPNPADLGYHSPVPMYEGQTSMSDDCKFTGGKCYYDGSGLAAEDVYQILLKEGSDGVWKRLEESWNSHFGGEK